MSCFVVVRFWCLLCFSSAALELTGFAEDDMLPWLLLTCKIAKDIFVVAIMETIEGIVKVECFFHLFHPENLSAIGLRFVNVSFQNHISTKKFRSVCLPCHGVHFFAVWDRCQLQPPMKRKKNMRSKVELCHVNAPLYGVFSVSTFTLADAFLTHFNLNLKNVK